MTTRDYVPDAFDLLGGTPPPDTKDAARLAWWQDRGIPGQSMIDRLDFEESMERAGWTYHYGPGTDDDGKPCVVAIFAALPKTAASESEWEARNVALHEQQAKTYPAWVAENLPSKESERSPGGSFTLRKTPNAPDPRIPKYEDSAHSKESRRQAKARELKRS